MNVNTLLYRFLTVLLGANMMSFAWPLRGQFGGPQGAMICGAMAGTLAAALIPWKNNRLAFAQAVVLGALGFVAGGENIPYGALIDNILLQPTLAAAMPEILLIFFIGASWGCVGATYLGYGISETALTFWDYAIILAAGVLAVAIALIASQTLVYILVFTALILFLQIYNLLFKHSGTVWTFGLYGLLGFGFGFAGSVVLLYLGDKGFLPGPQGWWTLRDQMWGALGGFGLMLAAWKCTANGWRPVPILQTNFQRFGWAFFVPVICGINLLDVYLKWFHSSPTAPNLAWAGTLIVLGAILLAAALILYLVMPSSRFTSPQNRALILSSFLFFSFFLRFYAIAKSIVYSGWGVWETGFSIFLFESMMLLLVMPFILLGQENP